MRPPHRLDRRGTSYHPLGVLLLIAMLVFAAALQALLLLGPLCFWGLLLWGVASILSPRRAPGTTAAAVLLLVAFGGLLVSYHRSQPGGAWAVDYLTMSQARRF